jgi:hypothetical protein
MICLGKVEDTKLDVLLEAEENPNNSTMQLALNNNVDHSFIEKLFKKEKYHPYKVQLIDSRIKQG